MRKIVYMCDQKKAPQWLRKWLPDNYPLEYFNPAQTYPLDTVFFHDLYGHGWEDLILSQLERGYRVIYDAKNEHFVLHTKQWVLDAFVAHPGQGMFLISGDQPKKIPGVTVQATPYWYWVIDQTGFRQHRLDQIRPNPDYRYKFLLTLNFARIERDYLYDQLGALLNESLHSYRDRGIFLNGDSTDNNWQRYLNPVWINQCCFTLAVETYINNTSTTGYSLTLNDHLFLCEKSYKPLAVQHPFMLVSTSGNLAYMRKQGFETFPELWDESYDDIADWQQRINRIVELIKEVDVKSFDTRIVKEKLQHNQVRFFDQKLVAQLCYDTIIEPILNFVTL